MNDHERIEPREFDIFAANPIFHVQHPADKAKKTEEVKCETVDDMES